MNPRHPYNYSGGTEATVGTGWIKFEVNALDEVKRKEGYFTSQEEQV
jgi:hypothetical protein